MAHGQDPPYPPFNALQSSHGISRLTVHDIFNAILQLDILLPPNEYLQRLLGIVCRYLDYRFGAVFSSSPSGEITLFATHGAPESFLADCRTAPRTVQHVPENIDILAYPTVGSFPWSGDDTAQLISVTRVPLSYQRVLLGVVELYSASKIVLTTEECFLLEQVAEMAAVAVASNQYLEQLNRRTHELQEEIARREEVESDLRSALNERKALEEIVNRSPVIVVVWRADHNWSIDFISKSIERFGVSQDDFYTGTRSFQSLIHSDDLEHFDEQLRYLATTTNHSVVLEFRLYTTSGDLRWIDARLWLRQNDELDGMSQKRDALPHSHTPQIQGILQDITERKQAEETIRHQAYHDPLTNLPNRALFNNRLELAMEQATRDRSQLAILFLDLDRFKYINDTLGHPAGDIILREAGARLQERLRAGDSVARLGGDEFSILLPDITGPKDAAVVARGILQVFSIPFSVDGRMVHISTSIGISLFPDDGDDANKLTCKSDTALYHAKDQGRNNFQFFSSEMNARSIERLTVENQLRDALANDQFLLYYQPQIDISTGQIVGVEALIRWQRPNFGLTAPAAFISIAEDTGLIEPIGEWVLRQACQQMQVWRDAGLPPMKVAVNLSARQLYQRNFLYTVERIVSESKIDPHYLELEITESVAMKNVEYSVGFMHRVRAMGIRLSLDDFGIGYSSLMWLKNFPITTIKIAQEFVRGLNSDRYDTAIATAVITLARSVGLTVIAEGVEEVTQLEFLRSHQCDVVQGFLFSVPLPSDDIGLLFPTHGLHHAVPISGQQLSL